MTDILITSDHILRWRNRCESIDAEIATLTSEKSRLMKRLEAADFLIGDIASDPEPKSLVPPKTGTPGERHPPQHRRVTFTAEIEKIVGINGGPLSYDDLKKSLADGPLAGKLRESDKGFYHAIMRLAERKKIVKHGGWVFSQKGYELYSLRERLGVVEKLPDAKLNARRSPMSDAVMAFVAENPDGVASGDIVKHLKEMEKFRDTLERNATGGYNVIARLVKRRQIRKEGRTVFPIIEKEPPSGGSQSVTGEVAASPIESEGNGLH